MKVLAINGSPRPSGNTSILLKLVMQELEGEGIQTELVQLGGQAVRGCSACYECRAKQNKECVFQDDPINGIIRKMMAADGILIGSPTYFADLTTETKALIDRAGLVGRANKSLFRRKLGAAVVSARRAGSIHVFDSINHFFAASEMIIACSSYWNMAIGRQIGEVNEDQEGVETMRVLGQNMAWLLKKIKA